MLPLNICGSSQVYKARWNGLLVAIKALANSAQEMESTLQREAAILQALRHPYIVKYLGLFRDSDDRVSHALYALQPHAFNLHTERACA